MSEPKLSDAVRRNGGALFLLAMLCTCMMPVTGDAESAGSGVAPPLPLPSVSPVAPGSPAIADRSDFILIGEARQGGIMRGTVPKGTNSLNFDGAAIPVDKDGQFLIAFDRDSAATATLRAELKDGAFIERMLTIQPGNWRIEHVNASMTAGVPSAEFRRRRAVELEHINAARAIHAESDGWRQNFRWPIVGRISGLFGSQRIYRGTPGSYHSGVDIAARSGVAFVAPADGVVILAAQEPFTLEGHLLMIDHGMGLNSAFLHCSSLFVKEGDVVRQGQTLGTVGATGRATGPHLHWGMKWNAARLDPKMMAGLMPGK